MPDIGPSFEILSILEPHNSTIPIRCGQLPIPKASNEGTDFCINNSYLWPCHFPWFFVNIAHSLLNMCLEDEQDETTMNPVDDTTITTILEVVSCIEITRIIEFRNLSNHY